MGRKRRESADKSRDVREVKCGHGMGVGGKMDRR